MGPGIFFDNLPWSATVEVGPGPFYKVATLQNDQKETFCSGLKATHSVWEIARVIPSLEFKPTSCPARSYWASVTSATA